MPQWRRTAVWASACFMSTEHGPAWFATLRRDRGLFALVGCLLLVLNLLQPLVAAQAGAGGHLVICTLSGAQAQDAASGLPSTMPENCPICLAGVACPGAPAYKAALAAEPAFPAPAALTAPVLAEAEPGFVRLALGPPPPIRAPPLSA